MPSPHSATLGERSDDELMLLASAGAKESFEVLVARHMGKLCNFCVKLVGDQQIGEEAAQETWLSIWTHRQRYQAAGKFTVLLYTCARNRCRNHNRARSRARRWLEPETDADSVGTDATADQLDALLAIESQRRLYDAIDRLPARFREAILLRFSEGLAYEDLATVLGRSESTIRSRVHYGLKRLRRQLESATSAREEVS